MRKCLHCNELCEDDVSICPKCGALVDTYISNKEYTSVYHASHNKKKKNFKLILWFLLGLVLPYIGFIVAWVMFDGERSKAKAVLFGAIVSTVISMFLPYILFIIGYSGDGSNDSGQKLKNLIDIYKNL